MPRFTVIVWLFMIAPAFAQPESGVREVQYEPHAVIQVQAKRLVSTMIVLPDDERILDYICGDPGMWRVDGVDNLAEIKPAKAGTWTNLHLVASSGRIYSFRLQEGTEPPDFKVFVTVPASFADARRRYVSSDEVEALRAQLAEARAAAAAARDDATEAIAAHRADYPSRLRFDYLFIPRKRPFDIHAIWHDGTQTFIRSTARELPALYEEVEGKANFINYQVHDGGTYVVSKVLDRGYLMLGKDKLPFRLISR